MCISCYIKLNSIIYHIISYHIKYIAQAAAWFAVACKRTFGLSIAAMQVSLGQSNLQGLFARFLWNILVCAHAKLGGPYSVQAAYEELLLIALVHVQLWVATPTWNGTYNVACPPWKDTCNIACPPWTETCKIALPPWKGTCNSAIPPWKEFLKRSMSTLKRHL